MEVGLRVVRGPDWKLDDRESDGGEGFVGTVVEVGGKSCSLPESLVWVQWDSGIRHDHRAGYYEAYDLCVLDSTPIGIKHEGIECRSCKQNPILGMCWKCQDCASNFNLCTPCYMVDEHQKQHAFLRLDFPDEDGVLVGKRLGAKKIQSRGIFPGAKVVRGIDWRWKNQDGGEGKEGVVIELRNWKTSPKRGVLVSWDCAKKETYRLGAKGKVDLKCVNPGTGGFYYKDHLPKLGEWKHKLRRKETGAAEVADPPPTSETTDDNKPVVGDTVCVSLPSDIVKAMNSDIAAWTDDDNRYLGKVGTLHSVTSSGGVSILYSDKKILTFHPDLVTKADKESSSCKFSKGAAVKITVDEESLQKLQQGHGPWNESVHQARGKVGKVLDVTPAGDVEVIVGESGSENVIVFNAAVLSLVEDGDSPHTGRPPDDPAVRIQYGAVAGSTNELLRGLLQGDSEIGRFFCAAVSAGNADVVEGLLNNNPGLVNYTDDVTHPPLIRACQGGHTEIVTLLLGRGADIKQQDCQGYRALFHAANRDMSGATARVLIASGANINDTQNEGYSTPLHFAAKEINSETMRVLLEAGCNTTLADHQGFTALHYSAHGDWTGATARILTEYGAGLNNNENEGRITPLHVAVNEFNPEVVEILIQAGCNVNLEDNQGLTALHLAAKRDISGAIAGLLITGGAELNGNINQGLFTPLHIAVLEQNSETVSVLVQAGCDVNSQNNDGNTALHETARRGNLLVAESLLNSPTLNVTIRNREGLTPFLLAIIKQSTDIAKKIFEKSPNVASIPGQGGMTALHFAALYDDLEMLQLLLVSGKVNIHSRNKDGLTPLDLATASGRSSVVQLLKAQIDGSKAPTTDLISRHERGQPETCNFKFGDAVQVLENKQIVELLQLGHGGWNPRMTRIIGKMGIVEEMLDTGDIRVCVQESEQRPFPVPLVFNPLALTRVLSDDNNSTTTEANGIDNLASESVTGEITLRDPLLEYAFVCDSFLDLVFKHSDELEDLNHGNATRKLFIACKMRWFTKVQEIIRLHPEAVNEREGDQCLLHTCCFIGDFEIVKMLVEAGADVTKRDHNDFTALHTAAMGDKSGDVTDLLLKKGADPSDNDNKLCVTPLHLAVVRNSEGAAKNLAARSGTHINSQDCEGDSAFHVASALGREDMVEMMLTANGIDTGLFNKKGFLSLHLAANKGHARIVRTLLKHDKQQVNQVTSNEEAMASIHFASKNGDEEVVNALIETNLCDFRICNGAGRTPQDLADASPNRNVASLLKRQMIQDERKEDENFEEEHDSCLEKVNATPTLFRSGDVVKVQRNQQSIDGPQQGQECLLQGEIGQVVSTASNGDVAVLVKGEVTTFKPTELVLVDRESEEKPDDQTRVVEGEAIPEEEFHRLVRAVFKDDLTTFVTILKTWPQEVNRLFNGTTLLHLASGDGFPRVLRKLIELGANVTAQDRRGLTPLQIAAARERTGICASILLESHADPNFQASPANNRTPLHIAVTCNNHDVVKQLIRNNCDVNRKDDRGNSPMHDAIELGNNEIAVAITEATTYDPLSRNNQGLNCLHQAVLRRNTYLLKRLLVRSPNIVNEPTREGDTAIHLAAAKGFDEIAKILVEEGHCRLDVRNSNNETPHKLATSSGHNELARLLWGEHDNVEVYEQLFAEMAQTEESTEELEQTGPELELSDFETSSVEGTTEPLDIHNSDMFSYSRLERPGQEAPSTENSSTLNNSVERKTQGDDVSSQVQISTNLREGGDPNESKTTQECQAVSRTAGEENQRQGRGKGPLSFGTDEIPDRLLCCICLDKQKNITFQCGHMNTCEECAKKITECPECKAVIESRLTTYY